jgi:3-oxoacyl-[acyl-carrier protein] reductase
MTDLSGRVALVSGGTRGIGQATAKELAASGATVVLTGRDEGRAKGSAARIAAATGADVEGIALDICDFAAVGQAVTAIVRARGQLDIFVANAGVMRSAPLGAVSVGQVRETLDTNVAGLIAGVQAAGRVMMRRRTGAIAVIGSIVGRDGAAGQVTYSASKAAAAAVAVSAAKELGRFGIRVNAVAPGIIDTDMIAGLSAEIRQRYASDSLLGRLGTAEDVARLVKFLVCDDSAFITGQVVAVDGGIVL